MSAKDFTRVLKGASMVLDQVVMRKQPEIAWRLERAQYHLAELLKVATEVRMNDPSHGEQTKETTPVDVFNGVEKEFHAQAASAKQAFDWATTEMNTSATAPNKERKEEHSDLIGFTKIEYDHVTATESKISAEHPEQYSFQQKKAQMQERAVPATQFGRLVGFGSLAVRMAMGEAVDRASHAMAGNTGPRYISEQNAERLAESLCRMRGAALKLGQMLSLQDETALPPSLTKALERVKEAADYMPKRQLEAQLESQFGKDWRSKVLEFDPVPIAAASIGQVHRAKLFDGSEVAMKIQYPGVAESIDSDLANLKRLVQMTNLLPPGLFVDKIIEVASVELKAECDYFMEAQFQQEYRDLILADDVLSKHCYVPKVYTELSTGRVLTTELVPGTSIDQASTLPQLVRNAIARTVLIATIRELFEWRFIQSDPNYANFLYHDPTRTINMIDFGAARKYDKSFVDGYMRLVWAAANEDAETIKNVSKELGFVTGDETEEFMDAHVAAGMIIGEPFLTSEPFDFGNSRLTARIGNYGGTFMKYRLTPPPTEAYSLHRKLAGAFLLSIKLKANIPCRDILEKTYNEYKFGPA